MKRRTVLIFWALALILLAAVLVYVNLPEKPRFHEGAAEGEQLSAFRAVLMDGSEFDIMKQRGKVVVINIWATWCTPCVKELPYFDKLQQEHPSDVTVLALHSQPVTTDVAEYLSEFSYEIPFAVDEDGSLGAALNASTVLPQTVIVNGDGVVTYNQSGSLSYEKLEKLVSEAGK